MYLRPINSFNMAFDKNENYNAVNSIWICGLIPV